MKRKNKETDIENKEYKKFIIEISFITGILLLFFIIFIVLVDPFYHYHSPIPPVKLIPEKQAYQNGGMARRLKYDAIITGSSMTENFRVSQFNELFNCDTIKLSFQGGRIRNYEMLFDQAFQNKGTKINKIFYGCDVSAYIYDPNAEIPNKMPEYLYDNNVFNDVKYVLNKSVMFQYAIPHLKYGIEENKFDLDEAYTWYKECIFDKNAMMAQYQRPDIEEVKDKEIFKENVEQNLERMGKYIKEHPEVEFNIFFPPYSILYYDSWNRTGELESIIYSQEMIAKYFTQFSNVRLSSFMTDKEIICNLNNYKDYTHYSEKINEYIVKSMSQGTHLLNKDNISKYFEEAREFLCNYSYDDLFI